MAFDLDDLLGCLALTAVEPPGPPSERSAGPPGGGPGTEAIVVEGDNLDIGYHRVFGGQILAQVLVAAAEAAPEKRVKSLHILFPREGDTSQPLRYSVVRHQEGRTFGTTEVVARQGEKVIAAAVVSVHVDEDGMHRSDPPPAVAPPADAVPTDLGMIPWETRLVGDVDLAAKGVGPPSLEWWMRTRPIGDEPHVHQALLAHATDLTLIGTALRPFEGISQADSTITLHTAVTSHTLWFHQPFRVDDWLLVAQRSPVVARGRTFGRGDVFAGDELVASFAQEAMVRQAAPS